MKIVRRLRDEAALLSKAAETIERLTRERAMIRQAAEADSRQVRDAMERLGARMEWAIREIERLRGENDELADFCLKLVQKHGGGPRLPAGRHGSSS